MTTDSANTALDYSANREAFLRALLFHLEPGWKLIPDTSHNPDSPYYWRFTHAEIGCSFTIGLVDKRLNISGDWPKRAATNGDDWRAFLPADVRETSPTITVSPAKSIEQIARDINRRFIPEYCRIYRLMLERKAEDRAYLDIRKHTWAQVLSAGAEDNSREEEKARIRVRDANGKVNFDAGYADISLESATSVRLDFRSVPLETAIRLMQVLKGEQVTMRAKTIDKTTLRNALHNFHATSGASNDYRQGLIVGIVSGLMATGMDFYEAVEHCAENMPDSGSIVSMETVPESWLLDLKRGMRHHSRTVKGDRND